MKLNEFEQHPLWSRLDDIESWLDKIRREDDGRNIDALDELRTRAAQLRAAHKTRRRLASLMVPQQLDKVDSQYQNVWNSVQAATTADAASRAQYLVQAISHAQAATMGQSSWPTPAPTQVEERAELAVVDALLEREKDAVEIARQRTEAISIRLDQAEKLASSVTSQIVEADTSLKKLVDQAVSAVNAEKARIATVIDEGTTTIAGFEKVLRSQLAEWEKALSSEFSASTEHLRAEEQQLHVLALEKYEALTETINDYEALVQADSADRLAKHYERAATSAGRAGWILTIAGFFTLLGAIVPLLLVLLQQINHPDSPDPSWQGLATRAGISAVLVGTATVAIRMGSTFQRRSADYRRLAMELRTMGPFLAAVEDTESVDQARLDLVNRTFGQGYAAVKDERPEDAVPVTVIQQLLTLLTKTVSR